MRILHAVTAPVTARAFLSGQLADLLDHGHEVHLVCCPGPELEELDDRVTLHLVPMSREPDPVRDVLAFARLVVLLRKLSPDVVVASTPKAGLLVGLAAAVARVPRRFYLLRGLRLEGTTGVRRRVLAALEVVTCRAAHRVVAVSRSLADEAARLPGAPEIHVVGNGSSNGVDAQRFRIATTQERTAGRRAVGAPPDAVVLGFVGRLSMDKGLRELLAVAGAYAEKDDVRLVVIGDVEGRAPDAVRDELRQLGVHVTGFVSDSASWYAALDVLVLPTHREGFPNVVLEAAACGLPAVTTTATGARDSVVDGVTGLLVTPGDAVALADALAVVVGDPVRRRAMGAAARARVLAQYDQQTVWSGYRQLWTSSG